MTQDPNRNDVENPAPEPDKLMSQPQEPDRWPAPAASDRQMARLNRVLEYEAHALKQSNPLESNLGSINSGLMQMALHLEETILAAMAQTGGRIERLNPVLPALDAHLRLTRQVDRYAQMEQRAHQARNCKSASAREPDHSKAGENEPARIAPPKG